MSTHLKGTLDISARAGSTPELAAFGVDALEFGGLEVVHFSYEIESSASVSLLPPALNPSVPPHCTWLFYRASDGPFGPFTCAQMRIGCRAGLKPRAFTLALVSDNAALRTALASEWGFRTLAGEAILEDRYDKITGVVRIDDDLILEIDMRSPSTLVPGATVPYAANLNLARTPVGLQLVQVEPEYDIANAEVGRPRLVAFDAEVWGDKTVRPTSPIISSFLHADVTFRPVRYVCDPNLPIEVGTTALPGPNGSS